MGYTPMMEQYFKVKNQYKDCILFYRLGDFYEMFFDDANIASKELELVLTRKSCGENEKAPMCGVPYHAAESYIGKLVERGYKVAIAEQMTDPALSKGLVEREVIRIVTPGTLTDSSMLSEKNNNYLASVYLDKYEHCICYCDISTGEFFAVLLKDDEHKQRLYEELTRISPKEVIVNDNKDAEFLDFIKEQGIFIGENSNRYFNDEKCSESIKQHYKTNSLKSVGLDKEDVPSIYYASGALLSYLIDTQKQDTQHLAELRIVNPGGFMVLDKNTIKNLEITENLYDKKSGASLIGILDACCTAMGSRKMKQWLRQPLTDLGEISKRLDAVDDLYKNILIRNNLRESLRPIYDFERILARISLGSANGKDLIALKLSLQALPEIKDCLASLDNSYLIELNSKIDCLSDIAKEIDDAIVDEPPFTVKEGGIIKRSYSTELDNIYDSIKEKRLWIAGLENSERERTGIKQIKVGFNKVFGYYIEISNGYKGPIPENYIRKQTLVNGERYITQELKDAESLVLNAQQRINDLEYSIFNSLRENIKAYTKTIQLTGEAIACTDVLCSFAEKSEKLGYIKPDVNNGDEIKIIAGRHPVIENAVKDGNYIPNDLYINKSDSSLLLITGPNMAGKSTYMRQLALIVLMAQCGCFVPADSAVIGICDRIYTRIGASDNISMGQSTFFVEMSELAYILNTATRNSLIILDEIGRGTSTYDGLSIAWAVVEKINELKARTLFATHYHELTVLENKLAGVKNLNVSVKESNGDIVFLHKIVDGSAPRSYGINVAKLAGVPKDVLILAQNKLDELEKK